MKTTTYYFDNPLRTSLGVLALTFLLGLGFAIVAPHTAAASSDTQLAVSFDGDRIENVRRFGYKLIDRKSTHTTVGTHDAMTIGSAKSPVKGRISLSASSPEIDALLDNEDNFPIAVLYSGDPGVRILITGCKIVEKEFLIDTAGNTVVNYTFIGRAVQQD